MYTHKFLFLLHVYNNEEENVEGYIPGVSIVYNRKLGC